MSKCLAIRPWDLWTRLNRDERGQLMPLILFLAIAFYTGVAMVVNTGRTTREKVAAQCAIDAAAVSGANALARGMNYLASNNITQAKLLASVVIVRAFAPAIKDARTTAKAVLQVAHGMVRSGEIMMGSVHPATVAIGVVLRATGWAMVQKITRPQIGELDLLVRMEQVVGQHSQLRARWADEPSGLAWRGLRALVGIADEIAKTAPYIAQVSARAIYGRNMERYNGQGAWLLPLYPNLPVCKGAFADFVEPVRGTTQKYAEWVYDKARWALVLSLFNTHYARYVKDEFNKLFTGTGTELGEFQDEGLQSVERKQADAEETAREIEAEERRLSELRRRLDEYYRRQAEGDDMSSAIRSTEEQIQRSEDRIQRLRVRGEGESREAGRLMEKRLEGDRGRQPGGLGALTGPVQDRKWLYPYLIDGSGHPATFTVFAIGYRGAQELMTETQFEQPNTNGGVFAAARIYNSIRADLWTPDWRAKLVASDAQLLRERLGSEPATCGESGRPVGGFQLGVQVGAIPPSESGLLQAMRRMLNDLSHH